MLHKQRILQSEERQTRVEFAEMQVHRQRPQAVTWSVERDKSSQEYFSTKANTMCRGETRCTGRQSGVNAWTSCPGQRSQGRRVGDSPPRMSELRQTTRASRDSTQAEHGLQQIRHMMFGMQTVAVMARWSSGAESGLDEQWRVRTVAETERRSLMSGYSLPRRMSSGDT